jgi:hypothetical protein
MSGTRTSRILTVAGIVALLAFTGDIVADSIPDLQGDYFISEPAPAGELAELSK